MLAGDAFSGGGLSGGDVSFTFLHRIEDVELNIEDGRRQPAPSPPLTPPDICAGIAFLFGDVITEAKKNIGYTNINQEKGADNYGSHQYQ